MHENEYHITVSRLRLVLKIANTSYFSQTGAGKNHFINSKHPHDIMEEKIQKTFMHYHFSKSI